MQLLLTACGSYGDVLPMVGLGVAARARGYSAAVIANPHFQSLIEEAGLECIPLGTADEYAELTRHPDLWHPLRGVRLVIERGAAGYLRELHALVDERTRRGGVVVAAHGLDLASRVIHDHRRTPLATVHFAPLSIRSLDATPHFFGGFNGPLTPRWLRAAQFWVGDRWLIDPLVSPVLNELRAELGLAPVRRVYHEWIQSPQLVLGLFPDWFAAPQADWPPQVLLSGFPLWDASPEAPLDAEAAAFLASGAPPLAFAPGSANAQAAAFFEAAVEICRQLGRRGILLTKYAEQVPRDMPAEVRHFEFVPFSKLLPHVAALVHHAGIGTCAQALASGVPQLAMPMAFDQLDNAERLRRLGVGAYVPARRFTAARAVTALRSLLDSPQVAARCRELAARCNRDEALHAALTALERLAA